MNDIKKKFEQTREKSPLLGDIITFSRAIRGMNLTRAKVFASFNKLVSPDDYAKKDKEELVNWIIASR